MGIKDSHVVEGSKVSIILERYYQPSLMPWPRNDTDSYSTPWFKIEYSCMCCVLQ